MTPQLLEWKLTSEKLPNNGEFVLVLHLSQPINVDWSWGRGDVLWYSQGKWRAGDASYVTPYCWARIPLPEMPQSEARERAAETGRKAAARKAAIEGFTASLDEEDRKG